MQQQYMEILAQSLKKKLEALEQIQALNEEQRLLLLDENLPPADFEKNVQRKADLIKELELLDGGFDEVYRRVREELMHNQPSYRQQITLLQGLIRDVTAAGSQIQAQEKRNYDLAVRKFTSVKKQIREVKVSHKAVQQYYQNMMKLNFVDPQFMDNKK